jgi:hypothetical protein
MRRFLFTACCLLLLLEPTLVNAQEYLKYAKTKNSAIYRFENTEVIIITMDEQIIFGTLYVLNSIKGNYLSVYNTRNKSKTRLELNQVKDIMPYNIDKLYRLIAINDSLNNVSTNHEINKNPNKSYTAKKEFIQFAQIYENQNAIVVLKDSTAVAGRLIFFSKLNNKSYLVVGSTNLNEKKRIELYEVESIIPYDKEKLNNLSNNGFKIYNYLGINYHAALDEKAQLFFNQNAGILNVTAMPMDAKAYFGISIQNSLQIGFKLLKAIEIELAGMNNRLYVGESEFYARFKFGSNHKEGLNLAYSITLGDNNHNSSNYVNSFQIIHFSTNTSKQFLSIGMGSTLPKAEKKFNNLGVYSATYGYFISKNMQFMAESFGVFNNQFYNAIGFRYHIKRGSLFEATVATGKRTYYSIDDLNQELRNSNSTAMLNLVFRHRIYN